MKFFFHYDKAMSQATGENYMMLHCRKRRYHVRAIDCRVPVRTRERRAWPQVVMCGEGRVCIRKGKATILPIQDKVEVAA